MEGLHTFGLWDQEIESWFTNHKPLIPTLRSKVSKYFWRLHTLLWTNTIQTYQLSTYERFEKSHQKFPKTFNLVCFRPWEAAT